MSIITTTSDASPEQVLLGSDASPYTVSNELICRASDDLRIDLADVLGATVASAPKGPQIVVHTFARAAAGCCGKKAGTAARKRRDVVLPCGDAEQATKLHGAIAKALSPPAGRKKFLVLINPFGGGGKAPRVWKKLEPLLRLAGLELEVIRTERAGHASELVTSLSLGEYEAILSVSGDGLVDLESEVIRCCGILRNTVWALIRMATLRRYTAVLSYRDAAGEWQTLEGSDWIGLWACNMPWMSEEDNPAPDAELDSGALDVLVVKGVGRISTLNMFLGIGEGTHLKKPPPGVSLVRATALRLDPRPRTAAKPGLLDVDGEFVPFGPIEGRCHPRALRVLSLPPAARGGE